MSNFSRKRFPFFLTRKPFARRLISVCTMVHYAYRTVIQRALKFILLSELNAVILLTGSIDYKVNIVFNTIFCTNKHGKNVACLAFRPIII